MVFNLGLIGYPLGHSLSPKIHRAALEACGLPGDYSLFPIHPEDRQKLKEMLAHVRSGELTGLNVTIPHKQNVIPLLDELTPVAKTIGAVNTIFMKNGKLTGDNTDAPGFLADLYRFLTTEIAPVQPATSGQADNTEKNKKGSAVEKNALVLGAGGSARAVVYALLSEGWKVIIASRRIEQAQTLIDQVSSLNSQLSSIDYPSPILYSLTSTLSLVVNTTPVGMIPDTNSSPWPNGLPFPPNAAVYDLVYNPRQTKLVKDARVAGLPATTGVGMLIEQAALSFQIWTGHTPPGKALIASVH